jgi:hypothetical protein
VVFNGVEKVNVNVHCHLSGGGSVSIYTGKIIEDGVDVNRYDERKCSLFYHDMASAALGRAVSRETKKGDPEGSPCERAMGGLVVEPPEGSVLELEVLVLELELLVVEEVLVNPSLVVGGNGILEENIVEVNHGYSPERGLKCVSSYT